VRPAIALARAAAAHHRVTVCSVGDLEPVIRAAALDFMPVMSEWFPPGSLPYAMRLDSLRAVRAHVKRLKAVIANAGGASVRDALAAIAPDLCLVDSPLFIVQLAARRLRIPTAVFHVTLPWEVDARLPPIDSTASVQPGFRPALQRYRARLNDRLRRVKHRLLDPLDLGLAL